MQRGFYMDAATNPTMETNLEIEIDTHLECKRDINTERNDAFTATAVFESVLEPLRSNAIINFGIENLDIENDTHLGCERDINTYLNHYTATLLLTLELRIWKLKSTRTLGVNATSILTAMTVLQRLHFLKAYLNR